MEFKKNIIAYHKPFQVSCDGKCELSKGCKDTYEGGEGYFKITSKEDFPTKWCFRQCDRLIRVEEDNWNWNDSDSENIPEQKNAEILKSKILEDCKNIKDMRGGCDVATGIIYQSEIQKILDRRFGF